MIKIFENYSLKAYNTFNINVKARYFSVPQTVNELQELLQKKEYLNIPKFVIGGGSNLLFTKNINSFVIKPQFKGIELYKETPNSVIVKLAAGEVWDDFVQWAVDAGLGGVENLSLIPGMVGATPVQNIGAYGVEVKDVLKKLDAIEIDTSIKRTFTAEECKFAYRDSIFKNNLKGKYIITHVYFELKKKPEFKLDYGNLMAELNSKEINLQNIRNTIIKIRKNKLPEPTELPNAGSFFKNPVISAEKFSKLKVKFANLVHYPAGEGQVKLAAGQLIDLCGLKAYKMGNACVHEKQALVLINCGHANGKEILDLAKYVQSEVFKTFGVLLNFEVNVI